MAPATVSGLRLDKYDVTVGRFRQFVAALPPPDGGAGWLPAAGSGKHAHLNAGQGLAYSGVPGTSYEQGWDAALWDANVNPTNAALTTACSTGQPTWTASAGAQENLPITCVNWYEAYAFCIWDGGFLPSDAEWEYTAAGGSAQREYPWGSTEPGTASQFAIYGCYYPTGVTGSCTGIANVAPVGTAALGAGLWGQLDLAGDVYQWNLDESNAPMNPCVDCASVPLNATTRVTRGGDYNSAATTLAVPVATGLYAQVHYGSYGFRCARTP